MHPLLSLPFLFLAAAPAAPNTVQNAPPTFPSEASVVVLDVVANDRKGQPVGDLRPDELQVFEDGKACTVRSFRLVRAGSRALAAAPETADASGHPPRGVPSPTPVRPSLVVLVFDRLGTVSAPLARRGALDLLTRDFPPDTWFAVFGVRYGVHLLQAFTTDRAQLQAAIERATLGDADKAATRSPVDVNVRPVEPPAPVVAGPPASVVVQVQNVNAAVAAIAPAAGA